MRGFTYLINLFWSPTYIKHNARCGELKYIYVYEEARIMRKWYHKYAEKHFEGKWKKKDLVKWVVYGHMAS